MWYTRPPSASSFSFLAFSRLHISFFSFSLHGQLFKCTFEKLLSASHLSMFASIQAFFYCRNCRWSAVVFRCCSNQSELNPRGQRVILLRVYYRLLSRSHSPHLLLIAYGQTFVHSNTPNMCYTGREVTNCNVEV